MRAWAGLLLCVVAASACSEPPNKERDQAVGAVAAARAADAAIYAPAELNAATSALEKYDAAVAQRDYRLALSLALEAASAANEAAKRAGNEKAAARSRAEGLVSELDALLKTAAARLAGSATPRVTGAAADHLRQTMATATTGLQEARTTLGASDYRGVVDRIAPIVEGLRTELGGSAAPATRGRGR